VPTADEAASAVGGSATLLAGLRALSLDQAITFTQYTRCVLPLDGYVFWLRTNATVIQGSLHVSTDKRQIEDETIAINRVIFTTAAEVQAFNALGPNAILVGQASPPDGPEAVGYGTAPLLFAFSSRSPFYKSASKYHYMGDAVYPAMQSQLIDIATGLANQPLIVSDSLPAWLSLQSYSPPWLVVPNPGIILYPSFLVPDNLAPPYGVVHIDPANTIALQASPFIGSTGSHWQLASDRVRITLYGLTNNQALAWFDLVEQYTMDTGAIGMMNCAIVRDEKRTQAELGIIAMKKTVEYQVSYQQATINAVARQLVESATVAVTTNNGVP